VLAVVAVLGASAGKVAAGGNVPQSLVGTWGKSISLATWKRSGVTSEPAGHYAIKIEPSGQTGMYHGNDPTMATVTFPFTTMRATVSGHTLTFGPTADQVCMRKGTYRWARSGSKLDLTAVDETCAPRKVLMTVGPFTLEH
jgi:hypothetical protein